ncbi:MAG TPA: TonB-dependent receptor [Bryobacteraceae bacterium]|nr:TonB-dependent receptor [Bryobacteraceae bacterium]
MDRTDQYFLQGIPEQVPYGGRLPQLAYSQFSTPGSELYLVEGHIWSLEEKYARTMGKHNLKFGAMYMRYNVFRTNPQDVTVTYSNRADLLANIPDNSQMTFGNGLYNAANFTVGAFAQDDWRVSRNLTLNLGVRYDFFSKFVAKPRNPGQDYGFYNLDGLLDDQFHFGPVRDPNDPYNSDGWVNLAPRLGFSYDPLGDGKTAVRGGYGFMFSPVAEGVFTGAVGAKYLPFRSNFSRQETLQYGLTFPIYNDTAAPIIAAQRTVQPSQIFNPNLQAPYLMAMYFGVQRALTSSLALETAYVGNRGLKFPLARAYNLPDRVTGVRPNLAIGQGYYIDNSQQTLYNSWQTSLTKRFSRSFTFAIHYTWAKAMATESGDIGAYYQNNANVRVQNFFDLHSEWGPADGDMTHYFAGDWVYVLPRLNSHGSLVQQLLGAWQISGIVTAATGQPLLITQGSVEDTSRPDYIGGNAINPDYTTTLQYLNKAAFQTVPVSAASGRPIRPGNVGHGEIRGPGYWNADLSLGKNFPLMESVQLQFRVDAFNALNHTNFTSMSTDVYSSAFGRFTNTMGARVLQLNARLTW